jgi:dipeptide/tripeptide permease
MDILKNIHVEWWQALIVVFVLGMTPIFKAIATILVARMVKPGIAKVALPLILASKTAKFARKGEIKVD